MGARKPGVASWICVFFISSTLCAGDANATVARKALSKPSLRERMEAVESLLKQAVLKLNPDHGFAKKTLTVNHGRVRPGWNPLY